MSETCLQEVAMLSTCNRTEFYCSANILTSVMGKQILKWWQATRAASFDIKPYLYTFSDEAAVQHLMRVASGLDSMILGEPQILGQLKTAFNVAYQTGVIGKKLSRLFQMSFSLAKRVRHSTNIAACPVSIAYAAVTLARQIFSNLSQATVLIIGAGKNSELILQHLLAKKIKQFIIVNRTFAHGEILAQRYGGLALPIEKLIDGISQADIVISSIHCEVPLLTQQHMTQALQDRKRRPIFMVDLGVPRNIGADVGQNEDIYLYTIDDLQGIITENLKSRQAAITIADPMISQASVAYMHWNQAQQHMHIVSALRARADNIKKESLQKAYQALEKGEDPKKVMAQFAHSLTQKLMHQPTIGLRRLPSEKVQEKMGMIKEIFSLE